MKKELFENCNYSPIKSTIVVFFVLDKKSDYKLVKNVKYWAEVILPDRPRVSNYTVEFEN